MACKKMERHYMCRDKQHGNGYLDLRTYYDKQLTTKNKCVLHMELIGDFPLCTTQTTQYITSYVYYSSHFMRCALLGATIMKGNTTTQFAIKFELMLRRAEQMKNHIPIIHL